MRDWAVCTIGTTARLEIDRFEKACAFEPFYGSECRLIPTIRRDLAAAKTARPAAGHIGGSVTSWRALPGTFCIVANDNNENELEKQIGPRDTHGSGYALAYFCNSERRVVSARRTGGTVSSNCRGLGDLRFALREA